MTDAVTGQDRPTRLTPGEVADLLRGHEDMVWKIAHDIHRKYPACSLDDVAGWVRVGFVRAATMYDPSRGWRFGTYAWQAGFREGMKFIHSEAARGMHVPESHRRWHAPAPLCVYEESVADRRDDDAAEADGRDFWSAVTRRLTDRERVVVLGLYRDGRMQTEVAAELGVCKERVRQILRGALDRLRGQQDLERHLGAA